MTTECLRARLLAERSAAKAAKVKIEQLEKKVQRLERNLQIETQKRKVAETALQDSLEKMLSSGESSCMSTDSELDTLTIMDELQVDTRLQQLSVQKIHDLSSEPGVKSKQKVPLEKGDNTVQKDNSLAQSSKAAALQVELRLPCAASLDPHSHSSDSDWSEHDEDVIDSSQFQQDHTSQAPVLPYKLHLSQLDLARKIGKSLAEWKRSGKQSLNTSMVDHMDVNKQTPDVKHEDESEHRQITGNVPYVSFSKYLGVKNRLVAVERDDERVGSLWYIKEQSGIQSNNGRIDQILHALSYMKI